RTARPLARLWKVTARGAQGRSCDVVRWRKFANGGKAGARGTRARPRGAGGAGAGGVARFVVVVLALFLLARHSCARRNGAFSLMPSFPRKRESILMSS